MIRPATLADIPSLMDLERACDTAAHWTEKQYQQLFQPRGDSSEGLALIAEHPDDHSNPPSAALGFLVARRVAPEWELENIVVTPAARRKGLGKRLLAALLLRARETNSDAVFLEVRESNTAARSLYKTAGFQQTGCRKSYYKDPPEDAILYRLGLA